MRQHEASLLFKLGILLSNWQDPNVLSRLHLLPSLVKDLWEKSPLMARRVILLVLSIGELHPEHPTSVVQQLRGIPLDSPLWSEIHQLIQERWAQGQWDPREHLKTTRNLIDQRKSWSLVGQADEAN